MSLLENYTRPTNPNRYLTKIEGDTIIRFLKAPVFGWKDLAFVKNKEGKSEKITETYWKYNSDAAKPEITERLDILDLNGKPRRPKHFWGCLVYNYTDKSIQYWELDKAGIMDDIQAIDKDWDLLAADLKITKTGEKMDTKYKVTALPPSADRTVPNAVAAELEQLKPNLNNVFESLDVFEKNSNTDEDQFELEDMPSQTAPSPAPDDSDFVHGEALPDIDLNEIVTPF